MLKLCVLLCFLGLTASAPSAERQITAEFLDTEDYPEAHSGYFEGDIELPKFRNAIRNLNLRWPSGIVYYKLHSSYPSDVKAKIVDAMREMESNTKHGSTYCVRFVERTNQHDYVYIQPHSGCHSKIGRQGGPQELSLTSGCLRKGTIMHELNHALGFWHEQNRYDRDTYVTIHTANINTSHTHDFSEHTTRDMNTEGSPYDYGSIMHYGAYTFAIDKSKPTISPMPGHAAGVAMGQRLAMSTPDVYRIQKLYQCRVDTSHITRPSTSQSVVTCNFDSDLCAFTQDTHDNFQWTRKSGNTQTAHTGPTADHTNSAGSYVYAEANGHHHQKARLLLPQTVAGGDYCVDFWLFQHGSQEGSLQIRASGSHIPEQSVAVVSGNKDNAWVHYRINLHVPASFHLIIQAVMGSGNQGDIAIDDFDFYHGQCI